MTLNKFHLRLNCASVMFQTVFIPATFFLCYADAELLTEHLPDRILITNQNRDTKYSDRIVGGHVADIQDHPHVVSYSISLSFCSGFIVSKNHILTAAHCVKDADPLNIILLAGNARRNNGIVIPIAEVTSHPAYDIRKLDSDIAIMKTVSPIEFGDTIKAIHLPTLRRSIKAGSKIVVSGWGRTQEDGHLSQTLMSVEITVMSHKQCLLVYPMVLTENMFCGGKFFFGGSSVCKGDSGGVVVQNGMAVGIVSFGRGCGQPLGPNVFTNIAASSVRWFIKKHTGI